MVSFRLALTLALVSFLGAAPADDLKINANHIVRQSGQDNNVVVTSKTLGVDEKDSNVVEEDNGFGLHESDDFLENEIAKERFEEIRDALEENHKHGKDSMIIGDDHEQGERPTTVDEEFEVAEFVDDSTLLNIPVLVAL